jgi:hypothetical protein
VRSQSQQVNIFVIIKPWATHYVGIVIAYANQWLESPI